MGDLEELPDSDEKLLGFVSRNFNISSGKYEKLTAGDSGGEAKYIN